MDFVIDFTVFYKVVWFVVGNCTECGGNVSEHINGKYYCDDCDAQN